jgi:ligand-binding sensor domain-containing protein
MFAKKLTLGLVLTAIAFMLPANGFAVSEATVLFLRIAPGARAAGMGEAYVAIADDATATHFNPAGLGTYPLSSSWVEIDVPDYLQPLKGIASLKRETGGDFRSYDVWVASPQGLVRYDHRRWNTGEVFSTTTNQTVRKIVKSYFGVGDEDRLTDMVKAVARANNPHDIAYLENLRDSVLGHIPEDYGRLESLVSGFDSLLAVYQECRINWEKVSEIEKLLSEGMKDSVLSETECDRINFAVERAKNRFIPEELVVPYAALVGSEITAIASTEKSLLVATPDGLFAFNGKRWQDLTHSEELPSTNIFCLSAQPPNEIYIGTDRGVVKFTGMVLRPMDGSEQLPAGAVTAIGASGPNDVWIVLDNDLYHWDGENWSNSFDYTVVLDDTPEKIAERFAVYGTDREKQKYLDKFLQMNESLESAATVPVDSVTAEETGATSDQSESPNVLTPGTVVKAPFLAEIKGRVNAVYVGSNRIWLGTEYGVLVFNHKRWLMPGYRDYVVEGGQTLRELALKKPFRDTAQALQYAERLRNLNDLDYGLDDLLPDSLVIKVRRNAIAAPVNQIVGRFRQVYFATEEGLLEFDGQRWQRVVQENLGRSNVISAAFFEQGMWTASDRKIVVRAKGRSEIALMHAKWLPELADDLYYSFLSFTTNSSSWGTFGGNVTFISYGRLVRKLSKDDPGEEFNAYEVALTGSYGTSLTNKLKGGVSVKLIHSRLSPKFGTSTKELGRGTSTGFALDFGLLYLMTPRLNLGFALTNIGPEMAYIDAAQADPLPRNLALGFAYELLRSDYYRLLVAAEVNKEVVDLTGGFRQEIKQVILNGGAEFLYSDIIAFRAGYLHDEEGKLKTVTAGVGLYLFNSLRFDFSYYFGSDVNEARKGIKPLTLTVVIP